ncbi:MAG: ATP-dependent 6-phosphofructokinase, partial [Thermomicrobiales bacterium]
IRRLAELTSGGDAPGMNAAIRSVVRNAVHHGLEVYGVRDGYRGLMAGAFEQLTNRSIGGIMLRGGTVLGSARAPSFASEEGRDEALRHLNESGIEALVVIGGNGSQSGSLSLHQAGFQTAGVASTIDNDLSLVDTSIGVDTALNTGLALIDRLRDTATSHHRAFVVEMMGRKSGYLALMAGIASGAEMICTPESPVTIASVIETVQSAHAIGKNHFLVVVAEGSPTTATEIVDALNNDGCFETRLSVLGHVQRGGAPLAFDRLLASRSGAAAVQAIVRGQSGVLAGLARGEITLVPIEEAILLSRKVTPELLALADVLSR